MPKKRVVYFDLLNIAACLAMVYLHCNTMVHTYVPGKNWMLALGIEVICYWAVPIFVMLSGANLMRYRDRYDTKTFIKKRFMRTFIPFVIWSILLYLWFYGRDSSPSFGVGEFWSLFMSNGIETTYWFFFSIFVLYLAMPVLSLLADKKRALWYLVLTAFVLQAVVAPVCQMFGIPWNTSINQAMVNAFIFYAILGYLIATTDIPKKWRLCIYVLGVLALIVRFVYTLVTSQALGDVNRTLFSYAYFTAVLPALAVFVWFKYHNFDAIEKSPRVTSVLARISGCTLGVYLMHFAILRYVVFGVMGIPTTSLILRIVGPLILYVVCVCITLVIKKIPVLKYIVP